MRIVLIIILALNLASCKKNEVIDEKVNAPYVISVEDNPLKPKEINPPFFGSNNFIIDFKDSVYYFQRPEIDFICGTGWYKDMLPEFGNLNPNELIKIPLNDIDNFVTKNSHKGVRNFFTIASQKDTLKSKSFFDLHKSIIKNISKEDRDFSIIRRSWQEEDTVLYYKNHKKYYNPDSIKWDMKRITFPKNK